MSSRRPVVLMGILLILLSVLAVQSPQIRQAFYVQPKQAIPPPLPGKNAISGLEIKHEKGVWRADFDYFFTGAPPNWAAACRIAAAGQYIGRPTCNVGGRLAWTTTCAWCPSRECQDRLSGLPSQHGHDHRVVAQRAL